MWSWRVFDVRGVMLMLVVQLRVEVFLGTHMEIMKCRLLTLSVLQKDRN